MEQIPNEIGRHTNKSLLTGSQTSPIGSVTKKNFEFLTKPQFSIRIRIYNFKHTF